MASDGSSPSSRNSVTPSPSSSTDGANVCSEADDIAIIGMSCRTSGGNDTPEKLWKFLLEKGNASGSSPAWRWDAWRRRDPRNAKVLDATINRGYFIDNIEDFDASFFGISPKEAEQMDPHQRLGLELAWEALEDAGIDPKKLSRSDTAVFMGVYSDDYSRLMLEDLPNIEAWMGLGSAMHGVANRISYHLDLRGPSAAVDAACASSMVAVDNGRQALIAQQSNLAIVGGVNVALSPAMFQLLDRAGALAPDGVCRSFDDEANGYARGEGGATLILKRLTEALADGDNVLGVLKASAVAQDGKTNGIMAPNPAAQELVARKALKQAEIDPLSIGYIEAHATSTSLGDPTEVASVSAVYGQGRPRESPALVSSIKPNIGHLEAAAGVISMVKAIMAVDKGEIPPQANLSTLNTNVDWPKSGLHIVREPTRWGESTKPRRAAVCSYGYGGTVTHAIIEQSPFPSGAGIQAKGPTILVITAPQEKRIPLQCQVQSEWISTNGRTESMLEVASTLAQHRAQHEFRAAFVVDDHSDAANLLSDHARGQHSDWTSQSRILANDVSKGVVWIFSGHGAQWADMGKELVLDPVFCDAITPVDQVVSNELGWSVVTALNEGTFSSTEEIQVLTYAIQVGLGQVLLSKGLQPQALIGHSVGEIAAAVTAGCITPEEGAIIVARRARLYAQVCGEGGMYLVSRSFGDVASKLKNRTDVVAAIDSSPSSCVISGLLAPLQAYADDLREAGVKVMRVKTDVAFHSPSLETLVEPLRLSLHGAIQPTQGTIPLYSTSQLDPRSKHEKNVDYWANNMVSPVRLTNAVAAAAEDGFRLFAEVSSHPVVQHSVNETLLEEDLDDFAIVATLRRDKPAVKSILHAIAQLYTKGAHVDFDLLCGRAWSSKVPGFAWSHKPYWKQVETPNFAAQAMH
ncbi:Mellein synthase [Pseudocercospora fuligena]|uniref:Mellein synthase n=1 Tax=Pseudocercospora fuligena TaxID=685502 RepID=A0A8H6VCA1_9PEZI|nr:Mellein synthase [Pseudocercospora fuligena]